MMEPPPASPIPAAHAIRKSPSRITRSLCIQSLPLSGRTFQVFGTFHDDVHGSIALVTRVLELFISWLPHPREGHSASVRFHQNLRVVNPDFHVDLICINVAR